MQDTVILNTYKYGLSGNVKAIASKSAAHRLLIGAALSEGETLIICTEDSRDISATFDCLNGLGADIKKTGDTFHVCPIGSKKELKFPASIDCGESGSTLRFLLPLISMLGIDTDIYSHGRLPERPLSPLYEEMVRHGAILSPQGNVPLMLRGKLTGGIFNIPGNVSSQYITGLLFSLPLSDKDSEIRVSGKLESRPYIDITLQVLSMYGIKAEEKTENLPENISVIFKIPAEQKYISCGRCTVEGDWSNSAFWLCAGALSDAGITTSGLNINSLQGDKKVLDILEAFGADIEINTDNETQLSDITVKKATLNKTIIDASDIPDLIPILSVVACAANGTTEIKNIERLRIKESDRVKSILDTLKSLGGDAYEKDGKIIINGTGKLTGGVVDSYNDHRIAMMAGIASSICTGPVTINGAGAVQKSYPEFFSDLNNLTVKP